MVEKTSDAISLREITEDNFEEIMNLQVKPEQHQFVAPNAKSMVEAHYSKYAWMRGIYANEKPVGFIMLADPVSGEEGESAKYNGWYFLWRLMIADGQQGHGYGRHALDALCEYVRSRPDAHYLVSSYEPGEGGPKDFYLKYGFEPTGEKMGNEHVIRFKL